MTDLRDTLMTWADRRIDEILATPRMWGSDEAVEMQVLQLLEMRSLALRPARAVENPREVLDRYAAFLRERFPSLPPAPLHRLAPTEVVAVLREFCTALAAARSVGSFEGSGMTTEDPPSLTPLDPGAIAAMRRARQRAEEIAGATRTAIDGKIVRVHPSGAPTKEPGSGSPSQ